MFPIVVNMNAMNITNNAARAHISITAPKSGIKDIASKASTHPKRIIGIPMIKYKYIPAVSNTQDQLIFGVFISGSRFCTLGTFDAATACDLFPEV